VISTGTTLSDRISAAPFLSSHDSLLFFFTGITIAPITSTIRKIPTEVVLSESDGLFNECAVNLGNIQTVQKAKIYGFIAHLSVQKMSEVARAIEFALALDEFR